MPDEISASTESGTTDSGVESTPATSASSTGAGEHSATPSTPEQNTQETAGDQIDIGWRYEDEEPGAQPSVPENDEDIEGMLSDPNLDQERTPGLVTALREARKEVRATKAELTQARQQLAAFESFGGVQRVNATMGIIRNLLTNPQQGSAQFLNTLYDQAYPAFEHLVDTAIKSDPDYAITYLQQLGKLPENLTEAARAGSLSPEDLARIPEELRDVAKQIPANILDDWLLDGDEALLYNLKREKKMSELDGVQRQQAEQQWRQQESEAKAAGQNAVDDLSGQYERAHYSELGKWKPYGPENEKANQQLYREVVEGAFAELLEDKKFKDMRTDATALLREAPMKRLRNEGLQADEDERKARGLAAQFNTRLGQLIRARVKERDSIYRDARAYRELQRNDIPNRKEIPGISTTTTSGRGPRTLDKDGRVSKEFKEHLINSIPDAPMR